MIRRPPTSTLTDTRFPSPTLFRSGGSVVRAGNRLASGLPTGEHLPMAEEDPAYPEAPPERVDLADGMALVRVRPERARAAVAAINESLEHLRPWMAWAQEPATEASIGTFFAAAEALWDQRRDFGY